MLALGAASGQSLEIGTPYAFTGEFDCVNAFDMFAAFAAFSCSTASPQADDTTRIAHAIARLRETESLPDVEVDTLTIRFCPLLSGTGIVPAPQRVYLDDGLRGLSIDGLAEILAHELVHVRQFAALGAVGFKCEYVRAMGVCGGCQDRAHPLERSAYEVQDSVRKRLAAQAERVGP